ncbi:MAG: hypothetical protein NVSMB33_09620 [Ktedonobacteraceae bacterium]
MDIGTPLGLAFASGINAYLPLLSFAISVRFLHLYKLNPNFAFVTSNWFMIALLLLTIADFVIDKIPVIDHTWDAVHTVIRPIAGALVAAASYGQFHIPNINNGTASSAIPQAMMVVTSVSHLLGMTIAATNGLTPGGIGLVIMLIIGGLLAAMSHTAKATTRLVSTATTAGLLNIGLSIAEDVLVVIIVLLSLLVPVIVLILLGLFLIVFAPRLFRAWSKRLKRREGI